MASQDDREKTGLDLENTGSPAKRVAVIQGRALKAGPRKAAEASRNGAKK